ncbi:LCP family protein [Candidatus Collierbacteria bacterium]|nr:LCP family protein [Candidatus Collierbacteria bacterium]
MNTKLIRTRRFLFNLGSFLFRNIGFILLGILLMGLIILTLKAKSLLQEAGLSALSPLAFFKPPESILENTSGRTNFMILGIRGKGADSPDLTDTMLIVSYSHKDKTSALISVPRDLWVNSLKTKINSVYHYGQIKDPNRGGIKLTQSAILETLGLPIHYTAVVDFSLFQQAISLVGGVDVSVERSFTDTKFPIEGRENALPVESRYETISFEKGVVHMDGKTALKFVRSRQAEGEEGTDIARDRRQQLVISALKQKIVNPKFLLNRKSLISLYKLIMDNTDTNIDKKIYPSLVRLAFDSYGKPTKEIILSYEPDETGVAILENPPTSKTYQNLWVLIARDNNWKALQQYIQNKLVE